MFRVVAEDHPVKRRVTPESGQNLLENGGMIAVVHELKVVGDFFFRHRNSAEEDHEVGERCRLQAQRCLGQATEMHGQSGMVECESGQTGRKAVTAELIAGGEQDSKILDCPQGVLSFPVMAIQGRKDLL